MQNPGRDADDESAIIDINYKPRIDGHAKLKFGRSFPLCFAFGISIRPQS
jgi:hypothetical protein